MALPLGRLSKRLQSATVSSSRRSLQATPIPDGHPSRRVELGGIPLVHAPEPSPERFAAGMQCNAEPSVDNAHVAVVVTIAPGGIQLVQELASQLVGIEPVQRGGNANKKAAGNSKALPAFHGAGNAARAQGFTQHVRHVKWLGRLQGAKKPARSKRDSAVLCSNASRDSSATTLQSHLERV